MSSKDDHLNRRGFIQASSAVVGVGAAASLATAAKRTTSIKNLRIGFIGPGGRGFGAHVKDLGQAQKRGGQH